MSQKILIIDDDALFCKNTRQFLADTPYEVYIAGSGGEGVEICRNNKIDVVILDQQLPDGEGASFCPRIISYWDRTKIIFITAYPSFENALKAIENGAFTYLSKPFDPEELKLAIEKCFRTMELELAEEDLSYRNRKEYEQTIWIGNSPSCRHIEEMVERASTSEAPVLITGETGTGKNLIAKLIHFRSQKKGSFLSINCAALPDNLIEAELFGFEKGSFSGAVSAKKGLLEIAEGGTILLDEIGDLNMHLQAKLLGALDEKKFRRIGGIVEHFIHSRIIAATNSNIEDKIERKEFRQDLFYRLNVIHIHAPPLRDRKMDIPTLIDHFQKTLAPHHEVFLPESELNNLYHYSWPGNIRELKNIIERSLILQQDGVIQPSRLLKGGKAVPSMEGDTASPTSEKPLSLAEVEKKYIRQTLDQMNYNYTHTAKVLGISLSTLKRKVKEYQLA